MWGRGNTCQSVAVRSSRGLVCDELWHTAPVPPHLQATLSVHRPLELATQAGSHTNGWGARMAAVAAQLEARVAADAAVLLQPGTVGQEARHAHGGQTQ